MSPKLKHAVFTCPVCLADKKMLHGMPVALLERPVSALLAQKFPREKPSEHICLPCLDKLRTNYIQMVLEEEQENLASLEETAAKSLLEQEVLACNINQEFAHELTLGEQVADKVAEFGGSWTFILSFGVFLMLWIVVNAMAVFQKPFDPFPFILLNLLLSALAALQAPVIMMSQNRQEAKDRLRAEHDYKINLKAELEIRHLHAKLDMLLTHQWQRLLEIQQIQVELMEEIARRKTD